MKKRLEVYRFLRRELLKIQLSNQTEEQFRPAIQGRPKVKKLGVWKKLPR